MRQEPSDADLMARIGKGDPEALGQLVDRHKDAMVNYLTRITGSRDRGEELAQEAFLRLFQAGPAYREQGRLIAYLFRIGTNLVRTAERRERRFRIVQGFLSSNGHSQAPVAQLNLLREEERRLVQRALAELPLRYRAPLVLAVVEGWSYQEIATLLGCREGTVKSRIARGRKRLRARLAPYRDGGTT